MKDFKKCEADRQLITKKNRGISFYCSFLYSFPCLCFVRSKCDHEKMFEMCFQSKTLYRKFAVTPREVWNVFAVPFLPGLFHTFLLWRARSHLPLSVVIVMPWSSLWESSEKISLLLLVCWPQNAGHTDHWMDLPIETPLIFHHERKIHEQLRFMGAKTEL